MALAPPTAYLSEPTPNGHIEDGNGIFCRFRENSIRICGLVWMPHDSACVKNNGSGKGDLDTESEVSGA